MQKMIQPLRLPWSRGLIIALVVLLSACRIAEPTPRPISPEYWGITVGETNLFVRQVKESQQVSLSPDKLQEVPEGSRFVEIIISVNQDAVRQSASPASAMEAIMNWPVSLKDKEGQVYSPQYRSWGLAAGDTDMVKWTFALPNEVEVIWLFLPQDVSVDLTRIVSQD